MKDSTARRISRLHTGVLRLTRGRIGRRLAHNDMLLLTTTGRRSATRHTVPLLYLTAPSAYVVIASWGGRHHHPDWYLNLVECPEASVNVKGRTIDVAARTADPDERRAWWPRIEQAYDGYRTYQARTDRVIPVVFLEPVVSRVG